MASTPVKFFWGEDPPIFFCFRRPCSNSLAGFGAAVPGMCPTGEWYSAAAAPSSADYSSSGKQTADTPPHTSESAREHPLWA